MSNPTSKGTKIPNVPNLRFESSNFYLSNFGSVADYKKGPFGSALKKEIFIPKSDSSIKVYEQQNAIEKDWSLERYFVSEMYASKLKSFIVIPGDIIVSCAGTIGEIYTLPSEAPRGIINQALMRIRVHNDVDHDWFCYAFSKMVDSFSAKFSNGSAIKNIPPFADLKAYPLLIPQLDIQRKIGFFMVTLDRRIEVQNKIISDLMSLRKSIMESVFCEANPSARMVSLSHYLAEPRQEKCNKPSRDTLITVRLNFRGVCKNENIETLKMSGTSYYFRRAGQLIYGKQNLHNGAVGLIPNELNGFCSSGDVPSLDVVDINPYLLLLSIQSNCGDWEKYATGTGSKRIHEKTLLKISVPIPNIGTHPQLIALFTAFDRKIQLETSILEKMKAQKKYLLDNLFI